MRRRAVIPIGVALVTALAHAQPVQTGAAAFGDWSTDAPGVVRPITPSDLPQPGAGHSPIHFPSVLARPERLLARVPPGFRVEPVASGLDTGRVLRRAPNGDVFLAESGSGRILILRPGAAPAVCAEGLAQPYGIAFWPTGPNPADVYVAETKRVVRFPYQNDDLRARGPAEPVVAGLADGGHWTRDIAFSPKSGQMFVSVGSATNRGKGLSANPPAGFVASHALGAAWGEEQNRANVLVADPDGRNLRVFATGPGNCAGEAIEPVTGALWCVVNERDGLGAKLPTDYATIVHDGAFYGWPWFYIGPHADPALGRLRADLAGRTSVPDVLIQPHSAPLAMTFYDGRQFPADYAGDAFVALHGSWNRAQPTGYKVIRLRFSNGRPTGAYEDFLTGFVIADNAVWGARSASPSTETAPSW